MLMVRGTRAEPGGGGGTGRQAPAPPPLVSMPSGHTAIPGRRGQAHMRAPGPGRNPRGARHGRRFPEPNEGRGERAGAGHPSLLCWWGSMPATSRACAGCRGGRACSRPALAAVPPAHRRAAARARPPTRSLLNQMFLRTSMSFFSPCSFCRASSFTSRLCSRSSMDGVLQRNGGGGGRRCGGRTGKGRPSFRGVLRYVTGWVEGAVVGLGGGGGGGGPAALVQLDGRLGGCAGSQRGLEPPITQGGRTS